MTGTANEPLWTDVGAFWVGIATAVGTIGAVIVSLWLASHAGRRERSALARAHAGTLYGLLAETQAALEDLSPFDRDVFGSATEAVAVDAAKEVVARVDWARQTVAPLMPSKIEDRWSKLSMLLRELAGETVRPGGSSWDGPQVDRARRDVAAYVEYVLHSIVAAVAGRTLPRDVVPPDLQRQTREQWSARLDELRPRRLRWRRQSGRR